MGNVGSCISWAPCVAWAPGVSTSYLRLAFRCVLPLLLLPCALPERLASRTVLHFVELRRRLLGCHCVVVYGCVGLIGWAAFQCALIRCLWGCCCRGCHGCRVLCVRLAHRACACAWSHAHRVLPLVLCLVPPCRWSDSSRPR